MTCVVLETYTDLEHVDVKKLFEDVRRENNMCIEDEEEIENIKRIQEERHKKLDEKLIFVIVRVRRQITRHGKHRRKIIISNMLHQRYASDIIAMNTSFLYYDKSRIEEVFDTIEEAEEFVERTIEKVKRRLEEIKKEYEKEKRLKEEEEIVIY